MASAEMSSSEILRQSRSNNAGEPINDQPEEPEAVEPAVSLVDVDESVWKKYSSHYEFPLSVLIALGIHILALLVMLAVMTISFYFGKPPVPQIVDGSVIIDGVGPDPNKEVGGSPRYGEPNPKDLPAIKVDVLPQPPDPTNPNIVPGKEFDITANQPPRGVKHGRPNNKFDGVGDGLGDGIGDGTGGTPEGRNARWKIAMRYEEPEAFLEQLSNLQVVVAARLNSGRFLVFKDLVTAGGVKYEELTQEKLVSYIRGLQRLGFQTQDLTTTENFAYGVNLSERIISLWIYIPQEMEQALLDAELAYHRLAEEQIKQKGIRTQFNVRRENGRYIVKVTKTEIVKPTHGN
jgi:hypothetical protein